MPWLNWALNELVRRWEEAAEALENGSDEACLRSVRRWIEEWDRRFWESDFSGFDQIYARDFVGRSRVGMIGTADVRGPKGFERLRTDIAEAASRFWFDIRDVRRGSDGRFAGLGRLRARGRYSGLLLQSPWSVVWRMRDRKLVEATAYLGHRRALSDLEPLPVG